MDAIMIGDMISRTMGFPLITYVPLQVVAILMMKHWVSRIAAALPLVPMVPVVYVGFDPDSYGNGSLYGIGLYFVYIPAMIYLAVLCLTCLAVNLVQENQASLNQSAEDNQNVDGQSKATSTASLLLAIVLIAVIVLFVLMLLVVFG